MLKPCETSEFEAHVTSCPECSKEVAELSEVVLLLAEFAATEPDLEALLSAADISADEATWGKTPLAEQLREDGAAARRGCGRRLSFALAASALGALFLSGLAFGGVLGSDE
ncbi:hypothetical protein [Streptomyces sp. NPDC005125]